MDFVVVFLPIGDTHTHLMLLDVLADDIVSGIGCVGNVQNLTGYRIFLLALDS